MPVFYFFLLSAVRHLFQFMSEFLINSERCQNAKEALMPRLRGWRVGRLSFLPVVER